ncbi:hypothetical protein [Streptomyces sp. NPDC088270]|uniref:hypothetical protein n=1 Tax=Streptomyces sp. NPDC088270 TaxID=3160990 RepID=UPI00341FB02C
MVFQDDITPVPHIARLLHRAVAANPRQGISLYVNWNSPQNAYIVRRAAVSGSPWAPLSPIEYTPTLGLVLPVEHAAALAEHLATFPDVLKDDDEIITPFRLKAGFPTVATVPHLLDHGNGRSLAGNDAHGSRHATVHVPELPLDAEYWALTPAPVATPTGPDFPSSAPDYAVEFIESTCQIRLVRPLATEPVEHPFGWYWYDWCALIGVERDRVMETWRSATRTTSGPPEALTREFWASCYLLGADARPGPPAQPAAESIRRELRRGALESWIHSGLAAPDRHRLSLAEVSGLMDLGLQALAQGESDRAGTADAWGLPHDTQSESLHA